MENARKLGFLEACGEYEMDTCYQFITGGLTGERIISQLTMSYLPTPPFNGIFMRSGKETPPIHRSRVLADVLAITGKSLEYLEREWNGADDDEEEIIGIWPRKEKHYELIFVFVLWAMTGPKSDVHTFLRRQFEVNFMSNKAAFQLFTKRMRINEWLSDAHWGDITDFIDLTPDPQAGTEDNAGVQLEEIRAESKNEQNARILLYQWEDFLTSVNLPTNSSFVNRVYRNFANKPLSDTKSKIGSDYPSKILTGRAKISEEAEKKCRESAHQANIDLGLIETSTPSAGHVGPKRKIH